MKQFYLRGLIILGFLVGSMGVIYSQQLPTYTQYKLNAHVVNPAISGASGWTTVSITAREQWLGFKGSPNTYTLSGEWRLLKRQGAVTSGLFGVRTKQRSREGRVGLGGVVYSDNNGHITNTGGRFSYAYHIGLHQSQLSFGASLSVFQIKFDKDNLTFPEGYEPIIEKGEFNESMLAPDASIGVYYLTKRYYAGLSGNHLFQSYIKIGGSNQYKLLRHYFLTAGYMFPIGRDYELEPSMLMKITEPDVKGFTNKITGLDTQTDINVKLYYRDDYWGGFSYRTNGDLVILAGVRYNQFYFAYSFDYTLSSIRKYSYGSHELSIGFRFGYSDQRFRWRDRY